MVRKVCVMRVFINGILCLLGYHTPPEWWTAMNRLSYIVSKSIAEVMYPPDTPPWPSYEDADILREIHDFVKTLIPQKRRLIGCLFAFTEVAPMLRPPFRRFSRIPIHKRLEVLNRWDSGRSYFTNQCAFSIRMLFNLAYLSNENVKIAGGMYRRN